LTEVWRRKETPGIGEARLGFVAEEPGKFARVFRLEPGRVWAQGRLLILSELAGHP